MANYSMKKYLQKTQETEADHTRQLTFNEFQRLIAEVQKAKETLSANQSTSIMMDSFIQGQPFRIALNRQEISDNCSAIYSNLKEIKENFYSLIGDVKIDSIQLLGGISRIPQVQKLIGEIFGKKPEFNMNGDDQPALGAAYHFAGLSAGLKIKKVELIDGPNYEL